jgi:hypothetical protein
MQRLLCLTLLLVCSACFPNVDDESRSRIYSCRNNDDCIEGFECVASRCLEKGTVPSTPDAGTALHDDAAMMPLNDAEAGLPDVDAGLPDVDAGTTTTAADSGTPPDSSVALDSGVPPDSGPSLSPPTIRWAKEVGGTSSADTVHAVVTDSQGNIYMGGVFNGTVDFGDNVSRTSAEAGSDDLFVVSYTPTGALRWVVHEGDTGYDTVKAMAVDSTDKLIIAGSFASRLNGFNLSQSNQMPYTSGFIVTLNSATGSFLSSSFLTGGMRHSVNDLAIGSNDDIYVTGNFEGTVNFGGQWELTSQGAADGFVARYNNSGCHWAVRFGSSNASDRGDAIAIDGNDNTYVTGTYLNTIVFGATSLPSAGHQDIYMASYDANSNLRWANRYGGTSLDTGVDVATDSTNNVYLTGYFSDTVDFGGGARTASNIDIFLAGFDSSGAHLWSNSHGGSSRDEAVTVAVGPYDNIYVSGFFQEMISFGSNSLVGNTADRDIFLTSYDNAGAYRWAYAYGSSEWDQGRGLFVDSSASVYLVGTFRETIDFGMNTTLTGAGSIDSFLLTIDQ